MRESHNLLEVFRSKEVFHIGQVLNNHISYQRRPTEMGERVGPRLHEQPPVSIGIQGVVITQPMDRLFGHICTHSMGYDVNLPCCVKVDHDKLASCCLELGLEVRLVFDLVNHFALLVSSDHC